ncbi:HVO_0649 family zinc finger protein [Natrialbaceae archaeon A-CW2]|uniref:HVO_0649 family zinc finger protein n=1 Tax=Natronosalvus amylolyticus TaxID=2961994 RepID=UPI0020CA04C3|nr:HVO_0649 family zinc finger protein [Natronosalvus amylolyticus]
MALSKYPLERYRDRLERTHQRCGACGAKDRAGNWTAETSGRRVRYRFVCPSCEAVDTRELLIG